MPGKRKNDNPSENEPKSKTMMSVSTRNLHLATLNRQRFPCATFGFSLNFDSPFIMCEFTDLIARYKHLEQYCFAFEAPSAASSSSGSSILEKNEHGNLDLFQAFFAPRCIAPRTSMLIGTDTLMTEQTLSSMWYRLVAHYFEWLAGVSELHYFDERDKVRLAVCQLCKVICYSISYNNFVNAVSPETSSIFYFGGGFYFDPEHSKDPKMVSYCAVLASIINGNVIPKARRLQLTLEEFVITKLIMLFDCTNLSGLSENGVGFARSMCNKYRNVLSQYVRHKMKTSPETRDLGADTLNQMSIERIRGLLSITTSIEPVAKHDDQSLADMVETNYGGMAENLQRQIHTESRIARLESKSQKI